MQEDMGEEETVEFLKKYTSKRMLEYGKAQAAKAEVAGLAEYTEQFRNIDGYKNMLTMEIVEDTEKAFALKVTGCVWASVFLDEDAGELGNAMVCHGDYAWAEGFNPKIKLVRDKTLMRGDDICNHRYIWQG